jgi:site-specific DNA-cytosine methylase
MAAFGCVLKPGQTDRFAETAFVKSTLMGRKVLAQSVIQTKCGRLYRGLSGSLSHYPPGFCFAGSRNQRYRQTGNAVPVKFAHAIAEPLLNHMARQDAVEVRAA